jgi:hypothetical protein
MFDLKYKPNTIFTGIFFAENILSKFRHARANEKELSEYKNEKKKSMAKPL